MNTNRENNELVAAEYTSALRQIARGEYSADTLETVRHAHRKELLSDQETNPRNGCSAALEHIWLTGNFEDCDQMPIILQANREAVAEVVTRLLLDKPMSRLETLLDEG